MRWSMMAIGLMVLVAGSAGADIITVYRGTNSYTSSVDAANNWTTALSTPIATINWDDVPLADGSQTTIAGDRYSSMPGSPTLSVDAGGLYVINPAPSGTGYFATDFFPVSGANVFAPDGWPEPSVGPEGILTITFSSPVYALGAWFLDVEDDYRSTGIEVGETLYAFEQNQGDNSQSFLGIISSTPFTTAMIHMSSAPGGDGVGIDNMMYALVPTPVAVVLGMLGLATAGLKLRKYI